MTVPASGSTGSSASPLSQVPAIPSTIELYDLLMQDIEPDLTSRSVPGLAAKYRRETPEQATKRAERYAKAFQEYDRKLEAYIANLNASIRKFGREAAASMEALENAIKLSDMDSPQSSSAL